MTSELLRVRNLMKASKPSFKRQCANRYKRFNSWRAPKGIHSKLKSERRGKGSVPSIGYAGPRVVRGLSSKGLKFRVIKNLKDLDGSTNEHLIIISSGIGTRKRVSLLNAIKERNLNVAAIKDIDYFLDSVKKSFEERKNEKVKKKEIKDKTKEEAVKKKEIKPEDKKESENIKQEASADEPKK